MYYLKLIFKNIFRHKLRSTLTIVGLVVAILAFGLLLLGVAVLIERRRLLPAIAVSVVVLGVIYAVFAILLQVPFPTGLLGLI